MSSSIVFVPVDRGLEFSDGGTLKWWVTIGKSPLSTPALADLDGDADLEVIVASSSDDIYAIGDHGSFFWGKPWRNGSIDPLNEGMNLSIIDHVPPPVFASPNIEDPDHDGSIEIVMGTNEGIVTIDPSGKERSRKGSDGIRMTPCLTDIEGGRDGDDIFYSISTVNHEVGVGWIEGFNEDTGNVIVINGSIGGLIGSPIVAEDIDGSLYDSWKKIEPPMGTETGIEMLLSMEDHPLVVYSLNGTNSEGCPVYELEFDRERKGTATYSTPAVQNITGDPGCEIFVASSILNGSREWTGWSGSLTAYNSTGSLIWQNEYEGPGSGFVSSPIIADIQCRWKEFDMDPFYEVIIGGDDGYLRVINATNGEEIWSFDTGGRIMSSPAVCDNDNDGELEIVVGSDSGRIFCLDGDPSDGEDEGIQYDGDCSEHDVLWVYQTEGPIGISSPVVADIDLDGSLEAIIGDANGNVYCISCGGRSHVGQADWTVFHGGPALTGSYGAPIEHGVDLYTMKYEGGIPECLTPGLGPGESRSFNITVENTGWSYLSEYERFDISIEEGSVPLGWKAFLDTPPEGEEDDPDFVLVPFFDEVMVRLRVTAPLDGEIGDFARINISAFSPDHPLASDRLTIMVLLDIFVDFDLQFMKGPAQDPLDPYFGEKYDRIDPGDEEQYIISLLNKGDINDSYSLSLSEPPSESGWEWYFVDSGTRYLDIDLCSNIFEYLGARSGATISINVQCPEYAMAYEEGNITVTGWSRAVEEHGINLTRSDYLKIVTNSIVDFYLTLDNDTFYCGQGFVVDCTIHSLANRDLKVRLSAEGVPSGCLVRYPEEELFVPWNGSTTVSISIISSPFTTTKRYTNIQIEASWSSIHRYANITMVNGWEGKFNIGVIQNFSTVLPGESSVASLKIISNYDRSMNVTFEVAAAPQGWSVKLRDGIGPVNLTLVPWGEDRVTISLMVPNDALMGEHRINITARSQQRMITISLPIRIGQVHGFELGYFMEDHTPYPANDTFAIPANGTDQVWFFVENQGNGRERVNLVFGEERITGDLARWDIGIVSVGRAREDRPDVPDDDMGSYNLSDLPMGFEYSTLYYGRGHMISFRDIWIELGANEIAWVRIQLGAPGPEIMELMDNASLVSLARTGSGTVYCNVTLSVLYPDLEVGSVTILGPEGGPPVHGMNVNVGITVRNNGTCRANDILVTVSVGSSIVASGRIERIDPGKTGNINLSFIASKHIRKYTIEIDPDNEIIESADQFMENGTNDNNLYSTTVDVEELEKDDRGTSPILFWAMVVITLTILMVGAYQLLLLRRRRRRTTDMYIEE